LLAQRRYAEAQPLLAESYETLKLSAVAAKSETANGGSAPAETA
jgi:hypothetical protein